MIATLFYSNTFHKNIKEILGLYEFFVFALEYIKKKLYHT